MKPLFRYYKKAILWTIAILLAFITCLFVPRGLSNDPAGKYASYGIFPHNVSDYIIFDAGKVVLHTCCDVSDAGEYYFENGEWIWEGEGLFEGQEIIVKPSTFGVTVFDIEQPNAKFFMRVRLTESYYFL